MAVSSTIVHNILQAQLVLVEDICCLILTHPFVPYRTNLINISLYETITIPPRGSILEVDMKELTYYS